MCSPVCAVTSPYARPRGLAHIPTYLRVLAHMTTDYKRVLELEPSSHVAKDKVRTLPEAIRIQQEKLKEEMMGVCGLSGSIWEFVCYV